MEALNPRLVTCFIRNFTCVETGYYCVDSGFASIHFPVTTNEKSS